MKEPVDHILRPSLPWRNEPSMTECGYDATKVKALTREEYFARRKELGQQRCAMLTCMTCSGTAERNSTWRDDPRLALRREIEWEAGGYSLRARSDRGYRLLDELLAIESIIAEHRAAFEALVTEHARRRDWLEKKSEHEQAKAQKTVAQLKPRL